MPKPAKKPRPITRAAFAMRLAASNCTRLAGQLQGMAVDFGIIAQSIEDTDARETRPDPRLRKKGTKRA